AKLGNVLSSEDTAKYWAKLLGITAPPQIATLPHKGGRTSVDSMTWVKDGTPVVILYSVQNSGHAIPLAGAGLGSPVLVWGFFSQMAGAADTRKGHLSPLGRAAVLGAMPLRSGVSR